MELSKAILHTSVLRYDLLCGHEMYFDVVIVEVVCTATVEYFLRITPWLSHLLDTLLMYAVGAEGSQLSLSRQLCSVEPTESNRVSDTG